MNAIKNIRAFGFRILTNIPRNNNSFFVVVLGDELAGHPSIVGRTEPALFVG